MSDTKILTDTEPATFTCPYCGRGNDGVPRTHIRCGGCFREYFTWNKYRE